MRFLLGLFTGGTIGFFIAALLSVSETRDE